MSERDEGEGVGGVWQAPHHVPDVTAGAGNAASQLLSHSSLSILEAVHCFSSLAKEVSDSGLTV